MALSDYEKQVLEQMEAQLSDQDPHLATKMRETSDKVGRQGGPRRVASAVVLVLIGVTVLITGLIATPYLGHLQFLGALIGVVGFLLVVMGLLRIFDGTKKNAVSSARRAASSRNGSHSRFMDRQQERWDRRRGKN